jgi:hypothetical protein
MNAIDSLNKIEFLSSPNVVEPISMPTLKFTDDTPKETLFATLQQQERQLKDALQALAVTSADLNDSHDIIKQWRAHNGFTSDERGNVLYTAPAEALAAPTVH